MSNESINWDKLGFDYIKTDKRYLSVWRNGEWDKGTLTEDNVLHISEGSTPLHYGQQVLRRPEGLPLQGRLDQPVPPGPERRPHAAQLRAC
jgi:hypothetical protein